MPRVGADIRLSVVMFEGPVEQDWVNFYGRPADASTPLADTLVVRNIPGHWFDIAGNPDRAQYFDPSSKLRSTFAQFGDIRDIDVEVRCRGPERHARCRHSMGIALMLPGCVCCCAPQVFEPGDDFGSKSLSPLVTVFDVWVQFRSYDDFAAALSALSNCTWVSAAGEATACEAEYDTKGHYSEDMRRRREARAR